MLPPYIIEQIRKREDEHRRGDDAQPRIELPLPTNMPMPKPEERNDQERGVVIIDLLG